jgi:hypothetical protein
MFPYVSVMRRIRPCSHLRRSLILDEYKMMRAAGMKGLKPRSSLLQPCHYRYAPFPAVGHLSSGYGKYSPSQWQKAGAHLPSNAISDLQMKLYSEVARHLFPSPSFDMSQVPNRGRSRRLRVGVHWNMPVICVTLATLCVGLSIAILNVGGCLI